MRCGQGRWRLITMLVMALGGMIGPMQSVVAIGSACRTDPKFFFGNGDKLTVVASIGLDKQDIDKIEYTVHAPNDRGEDPSDVMIVYTGLRPGVETATVVFDLPNNAPHAYWVKATVTADGHSAPVTFEAWLTKENIQSHSGYVGQPLEWGVFR